MLVPAILYKDEIEERMQMRYYTDDMFYYLGRPGAAIPNIVEVDPTGTEYQYACVVNDKLEGFFSFSYDRDTRCIHAISAYRFGKSKYTFALDVGSMIMKVAYEWDVHKVEWCCIDGNKAKPMYDRFIKKLGGSPRIIYHRDVVKDNYGEYHGCYYYEVIFHN